MIFQDTMGFFNRIFHFHSDFPFPMGFSQPQPQPRGELLLRNAAYRPAQKAQEQAQRLVEASALEQARPQGR